uniref:porin n=1 Tax=Escherichia coli TaxID=562 RepID=UPI002739BAAC
NNYYDIISMSYLFLSCTEKNMSTYVDYKINLLDDNQFTRDAGINTDNIVALGLVYQF